MELPCTWCGGSARLSRSPTAWVRPSDGPHMGTHRLPSNKRGLLTQLAARSWLVKHAAAETGPSMFDFEHTFPFSARSLAQEHREASHRAAQASRPGLRGNALR